MRLVVLIIAGLVATPVLAQTGAKGPSSTDVAAQNAKAADEQSKGFTNPTPAGASILVSGPGQSENCAVPISAGIGTLAYGATVVWARSTDTCEHRRTAWEMAALGDSEAAKAALCEMTDAREAYGKAGHPCP